MASLLTQTAAKVFGFTERTRHKPWFLGRNNEIIIAFNQRISVAKQAFITAAAAAQQDPHNQQKRAAHCHARQTLTQAKRIKRRTFTGWERQYWDSIGQQAEEAEQRGDHFALYSLMAKLKVRKANNTQANLRSTSRNPFAEAESWRQHFQLIQNGVEAVADRVWQNIPHTHTIADWMSQTPTPQELKRALQKMKVGKAPGDDGVTVEMLKWAPPSIIDKVITITQHIWQTTTRANPQELVDHWPAEWLTATVIPLWKILKTCKHNWRGVTLLIA